MKAPWNAVIARLKALKREVAAVAIAARDPRTPWAAKALALLVVAYALSPIDLIPDFIPVLGYLDDLILVPLGIWLVLRLIPDGVMAEARLKAAQAGRPARSLAGLAIILGLWGLGVWLAWRWLEKF